MFSVSSSESVYLRLQPCICLVILCDVTESSVVLAEAKGYLDSVEMRLSELQFADDVTSKRKTTSCLQDLDSVCELALDLIHSLQQKISSLSPSIALAVQNLATRHAGLSSDVQVSQQVYR